MKDKFGIFYEHFFIRTPKNFQDIKHFWMVLINFKDIKWMKGKFGIFYNNFFYKNHIINSIYFTISGFARLAEWICPLDSIKVTGIYVGKRINLMRTFFIRANK